MTDKISDFGIRLKEAFGNASNQVIAEKLGVGKSALTAYVQGRIPPPEKLIEISKSAHCNLHWLLTGEGSRRISREADRPQGIIIQGTKGGIGASTNALFIAATLVLKGFKILYADNYNLSGAKAFYPRDRKSETDKETAKLTAKNSVYDWDSDYYLPSTNKNLDFFFPRTWVECAPLKEQIKFFRFDWKEILKRYDFIVFDSQLGDDPFYYGSATHQIFKYEQAMNYFVLEPILRNAKVLAPIDVSQPSTHGIDQIIGYANTHSKIYPDAEFLGLYQNDVSRYTKINKKWYETQFNNHKVLYGTKLFNARISYHKDLKYDRGDFKNLLFSRRTNIHRDFSVLIDEILSRLSY